MAKTVEANSPKSGEVRGRAKAALALVEFARRLFRIHPYVRCSTCGWGDTHADWCAEFRADRGGDAS